MSFRSRNVLVAFSLAVALLFVAPQHAFADDSEEAGTLYQEGMDAYFAGKYSDAIVAFKQAYALDPNPVFLFNMSIAYEKAGNFDEALKEGWTAQESTGLPEEAAQINQARLPALGTIVRSVEVAGRVSGTAACEADTDCRDGLACNLTTNMCVDPASLQTSGSGQASAGPFLGIPFSIYGWIGSGVSLIGLGLTTFALITDLGLGGDIDNYNELSEADKRTAAGEAIANDIESQQSTGQVLLYSGGALVAVGAGLIMFDLFFNNGNEHMATFGLGVSREGASVQGVWRF